MKKNIYFNICDKREEYNILQYIKCDSKLINYILNLLNGGIFKFLCNINYMKIIKSDTEIIYCIYINKKLDDKSILKILKKIERKIERIYKINNEIKINIILSQKIKKYLANIRCINFRYLKNIIELNKKNKKLYNDVLINIIEEILKYKKENVCMENIYILMNNDSLENKKIINECMLKFKTINIVTDNIKKFSKYEKRIDESSELITFLNNKRKSLERAKYIINKDFKQEDINRYNVNRNAIIFNISDYKIKQIKCYEGIIVNNIKVLNGNVYDINDEYNINSTEEYKKNIIKKYINTNKYVLEGNNGNIELKELQRIKKYY